MTTRDWPTGDAFKPASPLQLSLDSSQSTARGFYTGNTQRLGHSDRLRGVLQLPPSIDPTAGGKREAFMLRWRSTGDLVRIPMWHRRWPNGTLRGSPVVASDAAAGVRSIALSNCTGTNLLLGGSFEFDTNADGVSDGWATYNTGTVSGITYGRTLFDPVDGVYEQYITVSSLGTTATDLAGIYKVIDFAAYPGTLTASVRIRGFGNVKATISAKCETAGGGSVLSTIVVASATADGTPVRIGGAFTPPATTQRITLAIYITERTGADTSRTGSFDAVCLRTGTHDASWPGRTTLLAGDYIGIGGNLLCVDVDGAEANDAGAMTVPLSLPLQKVISSSAAVTWNAPTGVWELDDAGLQLDYSAGNLQGGFAIPIRQYIA